MKNEKIVEYQTLEEQEAETRAERHEEERYLLRTERDAEWEKNQ